MTGGVTLVGRVSVGDCTAGGASVPSQAGKSKRINKEITRASLASQDFQAFIAAPLRITDKNNSAPAGSQFSDHWRGL